MNKMRFMRLWDIYNGLLTPTQQEITDMYFNLDLTVSEIADEKGITRQAVSECLKTCKKQFEEYESKLHFSKSLTEVCLQTSYLLTDANRWAEKFCSAHPEFIGEIDGLLEILNKDYSVEANEALQNPETRKMLDKDYSKQFPEDNN